ncbi:uncharacterized protein LOC122389701 isoform X2 [Amphibalanus amphitrite]|uniref:uncharacterized protein LOC122389701 isoform X2 n=1 Tax=Amphibalanus amphitrite TaxID=1232801 RepID=UPI001C91000D|nr:uncharacterized protein LOC122389701 isoform X2 [Amphibalanus amphitrite]
MIQNSTWPSLISPEEERTEAPVGTADPADFGDTPGDFEHSHRPLAPTKRNFLEMSFDEFLAEGELQEAKRRAVPAFESRPAHLTGISLDPPGQRQRRVDPLLFMASLQSRLHEPPPENKEVPLLRKVRLQESYRLVRRTEWWQMSS